MTTGLAVTGTIVRAGDTYTVLGRPIAASNVRRLVDSIESPQIPIATASSLGVGPAFLQRYSPGAAKSGFGVLADIGGVSARFTKLFEDPNEVASFIRGNFLLRAIADDYSSESLSIYCSDKSILKTSSSVASIYMLPWTVTINGHTTETYNVDISRSLSAMLGSLSANAERLSDDEFAREYARAVARTYEDRFGSPDALELIPHLKEGLARGRFLVREPASLWNDRSIDLVVSTTAFGPNLDLREIIPIDASTDPSHFVIQRLVKVADRLRTLRWLVTALGTGLLKVDITDENAESSLTSYVAGDVRRLSDAGRALSAQMLASETHIVTMDISIQSRDGLAGPNSTWYLFPDGSAMLAGFNAGALKPFGLDETLMTPKIEYRMASGEIISPDGTLRLPTPADAAKP
jgi:hypothetical protein